MNRPKGLGAPGRALWRRLTEVCDLEEGAELLLAELCTVADRLHQVRQAIKRDGVATGGKGGKILRAHPLLAHEPKLVARYEALWKLLGLARDEPDATKRIGRPPGT